MAIPVQQTEVEQALLPWLGSVLLMNSSVAMEVTHRLQTYAPYRQDLIDFRHELETLLLIRVQQLTNKSMRIVCDNYHSYQMGSDDLEQMTDVLMGLLFDKLTPFSANFTKLNDYSLQVPSLSALRVLYLKYPQYYTCEQLEFLKKTISRLYPVEAYQSWLK